MSRHIACKTIGGEYDYCVVEGYAIAVVELDDQYLKSLWCIVNEVRDLRDKMSWTPAEVSFYDMAVNYYDWDSCEWDVSLLDEPFVSSAGRLRSPTWIKVPSWPTIKPSRVEIQRLNILVLNGEFYWSASPRHTDLTVETQCLTLNEISKMGIKM